MEADEAGVNFLWDGDLIDNFLSMTASLVSPPLFRLWAGIALVAGALERRVWIKSNRGLCYPNMFTMLVAPPGVGKFAVERVKELWLQTKNPHASRDAFHVAPNSITKASFIDGLELAKQNRAGMPPYHSLLTAAEELGVFMPNFDPSFVALLNSLWNSPTVHRETRRYGPAKDSQISHPCVNFLCGTQPAWLASMFPEEAWSTGLTSRMIMVYASESPFIDLFDEIEDSDPKAEGRVLSQLGQLTVKSGQCQFSSEAAGMLRTLDRAGIQPKPTHSKLEHYVRRRSQLLQKLTIIATFSRTGAGTIELIDVERALEWLLDAEKTMPDIFRAMVGRSDIQVIRELHAALVSQWQLSKGKPVGAEFIYAFLAERVPSDKAPRVLEMAEKAGYLVRMAGTEDYRPAGKFTGVE